eukprot:COSAG01_NODE_9784_length_2344_cov_3.924276_2_plen_99_part_00
MANAGGAHGDARVKCYCWGRAEEPANPQLELTVAQPVQCTGDCRKKQDLTDVNDGVTDRPQVHARDLQKMGGAWHGFVGADDCCFLDLDVQLRRSPLH